MCVVPRAAGTLNDTQYLVPRMSRPQLREAIEGPAAVFPVRISDALVEHVLNDAGDDPDQLPVLQHALLRTWQEVRRISAPAMDVPHYEVVGGIASALDRDADEVYRELAVSQPGSERIVRRLFQRLVEPGAEDEETRRPTSLEEIANISGAPEAQVLGTAECFRDRGFLSITGKKQTLDLSHESLIRRWKRLREWVAEESESAAVYKRLVDTALRKGSLYTGPDLAVAGAWKRREDPNEHWAARYAAPDDFALAMEFLQASEAEDQKRERRKRRNWYIATGGSLFVAALLAVLVAILVVELDRANRAEGDNRARDLIARSRDLRTTDASKTELSLLLALEALRHASSEAANAIEQVQASVEMLPIPVARLDHGRPVRAAVFGPQDRFAATLPEGQEVILWDLNSRRQVDTYRSSSRINSFAFSDDRGTIGTADAGGGVRVWQTLTGAQVADFHHSDAANAVAFQPGGRLLASAGDDRSVRVWDLTSRKELGRAVHGASVRLVAFHPAGKLLASAGDDGGARIWNVPELKPAGEIQSRSLITALAFSSDCDCVVAVGYDGILRAYDAQGRRMEKLPEIRARAPRFAGDRFIPIKPRAAAPAGGRKAELECDFNSDRPPSQDIFAPYAGRIEPRFPCPIAETVFGAKGMLTVDRSSTARFLPRFGEREIRFQHSGEITGGDLEHSGDWEDSGHASILTASADQTARLWRIETPFLALPERGSWQVLSADGRHLAVVNGSKIEIYSAPFQSVETTLSAPPADRQGESLVWGVELSDKGELLAAQIPYSVFVWDVGTGRRLPDIPVHRPGNLAVAKNALMVSSQADPRECLNKADCRQLEFYDPASGKRIGHSVFNGIRDAALSRNGQFAAFTTGGRQLYLWHVSDRSPVITGIEIDPYRARFRLSPDAEWLAACGAGSDVAVLRTNSPAEIRKVNTSGGACRTVAFDSTGKLLAVGSDSGISVWNTADLSKVRDLSIAGSEKDVSAAAFNFDGSLLVTVGSRRLLRIWRWRQSEELSRIGWRDEDSPPPAFAYGDRLFAGRLFLWKPADVIAEACRHLTSELTPDEIALYLPGYRSHRPVCAVPPEVRQMVPRK